MNKRISVSKSKKSLYYLFLLVPYLATFIIIEIGFRFYAYYYDVKLENALQNIGTNINRDDRELRLRHIIRLNKNPKIIYELIPNVAGSFAGANITINEQGFRGPLVKKTRNTGVLRIAGLGDSVMFGWGVGDNEYYLSLLPKMLKIYDRNINVDITNSAVPGYNTAMEVETLERKLLEYHPDIVVIDYVPNDLNLPSFIKKDTPYFDLRKSFFYKFVKDSIKGIPVSDHRLSHPPRSFRNTALENDPDRIPLKYQGLMGVKAFQSAMTRLKRLSEIHNFKVIVFAHSGMARNLWEICKTLRFPIVDAVSTRHRYMQKHGIKKYLGSELTISKSDIHPSKIQHRLLAKLLSKNIKKLGWLEFNR